MIQKAVEKDYDKFPEIVENDGFSHPNKFSLDWVYNRIKLGDEFYVYFDGKIKGFMCFQPEFSNNSRLHFISVLKQEQGKGIGTTLVEKAVELTRKLGKTKLYLYVHQKNKKAIDFYIKKGFCFSGIFLDKYGESEHALLMRRDI